MTVQELTKPKESMTEVLKIEEKGSEQERTSFFEQIQQEAGE